jgi:hypothetical protein
MVKASSEARLTIEVKAPTIIDALILADEVVVVELGVLDATNFVRVIDVVSDDPQVSSSSPENLKIAMTYPRSLRLSGNWASSGRPDHLRRYML